MNVRRFTKRQKIWISIGTAVLCGLIIFLPVESLVAVLAVIGVAAYCFVAYYARIDMENHHAAKEAKRSQRDAVREFAERHMEDRRRR